MPSLTLPLPSTQVIGEAFGMDSLTGPEASAMVLQAWPLEVMAPRPAEASKKLFPPATAEDLLAFASSSATGSVSQAKWMRMPVPSNKDWTPPQARLRVLRMPVAQLPSHRPGAGAGASSDEMVLYDAPVAMDKDLKLAMGPAPARGVRLELTPVGVIVKMMVMAHACTDMDASPPPSPTDWR